jgi:predicted nucleic-acid-binding protein
MTITVDTNVLVRMVVRDDTRQTQLVRELFDNAATVSVGMVALCELVWILRSRYKIPSPRIADFIRTLLNTSKVELNRSAVEAGLAILDAGGDFADGAIAYEGSWLGGELFVSFDKVAVSLLNARGLEAKLLQ